ncbi:MAG: peptidase S11 [Nitrospirae bacterium]|nr:peptidase S11 [Candidatus Manganitrophaceae bacterium]
MPSSYLSLKIKLKTLLITLLFLTFQLVFLAPVHAQAKSESTALQKQTQSPDSLLPFLNPKRLFLRSERALIINVADGEILLDRKKDVQQPIASITKLMTAMVVIDANLQASEVIHIKRADRDRLRGSGSRLSYGTQMTRADLLKITLAGSDNRAAAALGRTYPGGHKAIVAAMNKKAKALGLNHTVFKDVSGLRSGNVSTASDLALLVDAAKSYAQIQTMTTIKHDHVTDLRKGWKVEFRNTNRLMQNKKWDISLSKTGYIADSGHCLVMQVTMDDRTLTIVLLNSWGKLSKYGDANRIRKWLHRADQQAKKAAKASKERAAKVSMSVGALN